MLQSLIGFLRRLLPRFVPYKGWAVDIPDLLLITLIGGMFLPILPLSKESDGFKVLGFRGSNPNQYALPALEDFELIRGDINLKDTGTKETGEKAMNPGTSRLLELINAPIIDTKKTKKDLQSKSIGDSASTCISWLFFASSVLENSREISAEISSLAPSTVPAIWLIRLPQVGILHLISDLELQNLYPEVLDKCKGLGLEPTFLQPEGR